MTTHPTETLLHNRYRILNPLGQGGMGAVYLADGATLSGRRAAVKENLNTSPTHRAGSSARRPLTPGR